MIQLSHITKVYRNDAFEIRALDDLSLTIEAGEFVAIMGPSGSGKSTLLHMLGFLDRPDSGAYQLSGQRVDQLSDEALANLRNLGVGFVFQQFHLLRRMSAHDNVQLPAMYRDSANQCDVPVVECLKSVDLADRSTHYPNELSGGQQQRVAIARALINDPIILLADEPTGNLDTASGRDIMGILESLNAAGKTIIMVTHEKEIAHFARRVIMMRDGRIISDERKESPPPKTTGNFSIQQIVATHRASINWREFVGHFKQAIRAVRANRMRSFLSMLGIMVGVSAVIAMMALGAGATASIEEGLQSLGSNLMMVRGGDSHHRGVSGGMGTVTRFTFNDINDIDALTSLVKTVSGTVRGSAQVVYQNNNWSTSVEGVGAEYAVMRATEPVVGHWFNDADVKARAKVAIVGATVASQLFGRQNPVGNTIKINRINFKVIGVAPTKGSFGPRDHDDVIYIPVTTAMYRLMGKDYLDGLYVEVKHADMMDSAIAAITSVIKKNHKLYQDEESFHIRDMNEIREVLSGTMQTMGVLLGGIAAISLLVGGIGIMNIMLVSVTERTREIGLRKAIGARRLDILTQFLIESIVMTLGGGVLGTLTGVAVSVIMSLIVGWPMRVTLLSIVLATTVSMLIGLCFGLWPAKKAARLDPIDALRYE